MTETKIRVLLVEDNPTDAMLVQDELAHSTGSPFAVVQVDNLKGAISRLHERAFDVVLLDLSLPDSFGFDTFVRIHDQAAGIPIVVLSGGADGKLAVQAVQAGAQDYLVKGRLGEDVLPRSIRYAIERRRADEALQLMRFCVDRAGDGMFWISPEGRLLYVNEAACNGLGYTEAELLKLSIFDLDGGYQPAAWAAHWQELKERGNMTFETQHRSKNGRVFPIEVSCNYVQSGGREFDFAFTRDITERKRSEKRFRWLVDSNAQGVMFWNTSGGTTGANDAFLGMVGYTREDLEAGRLSWKAMTAPGYEAADRQAMIEIGEKGFSVPYEKEFTRKDGSQVPVLLGTSVFDDDPEEGVCFVLDLTERKKAEQNSLRAQRMESIGTLAGGIAHDLNNSLSPIIMALELLQARFPDPESQELLSILSSSALHGADMVKQVLSFARGVEGERMEVQPRHLLLEVAKIVRDTFVKNIQVRTVTPTELWTVQGDPTQLHQVLLNLCVNARDAMPNGGTLTLSAENLTLDEHYAGLSSHSEAKPGPYVLLQVKDSGTGMPPEVMEKIFDPFFTTKELGKGTGLGLSTTMAILKSHGGFIRVYSEVGKGTQFRVYLPAQLESSEEKMLEQAIELPRGKGELILVVDDETAIRQITQQTLESFGYRTVLAAEGAEAVAIYARQGAEIAVVITDMMMPIMDGAATIQILRRLNPLVRVIGASGLSAEGHVAHAASLGMKHFLPKPYTAEILLKTLKEVLSGGA
jgi:two-component system cell cycle sensor histidine kinase/response regulator CckA